MSVFQGKKSPNGFSDCPRANYYTYQPLERDLANITWPCVVQILTVVGERSLRREGVGGLANAYAMLMLRGHGVGEGSEIGDILLMQYSNAPLPVYILNELKKG